MKSAFPESTGCPINFYHPVFSAKRIELDFTGGYDTWEIEVLSSFSVVLSWLGQTCAAVSEAAALVSLHYSSISGSCAKESLLNSRGERTCSCSAYSILCLISSNFQTISVKFQKSMPFDEFLRVRYRVSQQVWSKIPKLP